MPLMPNFVERLLFKTFNVGPAPAMDVWSGSIFWTVHAALKLDVFVTLAKGPQSSQALANQLNSDERGITVLLGLLESLGYVMKGKNGAYHNTRMTKKWMLDGGEINFSPFYMYWGALTKEFMPNLHESIQTGKPPVHMYEWIEDQPEISDYFQKAMIQIARSVGDDIAKGINVPAGAKRVLDVGGGHGEYTVTLCRRYPQLEAVIFDSEQALVTGQMHVKNVNMSDRITTHAGNFVTDPLPDGGFDIVLVFNVVHGLSAEGNTELFRKIKDCLNPNGQIIVVEQVHGIAPLPLINASSHILSMAYYHLIGGQVYTYAEIKDWLHAAGYTDVSKKNILKASSILVSGR